jgi:peroxiredoxin
LPSVIEHIQQEYRDRGLTVLAINMKESLPRVTRWVQEKNVSFTVLLDRDGAVTHAYDITATPAVFVVGRDGRLVAKAVGTKDWDGPRGRAVLEAVLAER